MYTVSKLFTSALYYILSSNHLGKIILTSISDLRAIAAAVGSLVRCESTRV